ncbi:hypothetical protein WN55_00094 [Dufourea novaeangliae]|uniref:Uncharacterized protein n=1 Tax=Dufourea novaeangliae TaxID=178035 RepID=A0A154NXU6_DUFNO|nr:hypothetical protein WN55_00094 [Dufourea novaeangliae]
MYSLVLSVAAYTLLLSSFITIVTLLRKQFTQWMNTSLYILSMSDVLFSILTASIILINYMAVDKTNWDNIIFLSNIKWDEEDQKDRFIKFHKMFNDSVNRNNFSMSSECNIMHTIIQYGMFLVPFTNSFVSLLVFSTQCNLNVFSLKYQCLKSFQLQGYVVEKMNETDSRTSKSKVQSTESCETIERENIQFDLKCKLIERFKRRFLRVFKYNEIKKDNKMTVTVFVISQWIIPILVTGLLFLSEYDNRNYIKDLKNMECFTGNNLLFDDCQNNIKVINTIQNYSSLYAIPLHQDYINNTEPLHIPNENNTQVNEIIFKVQNIVHSALQTHNTSYNINHARPYNTSDQLNMMKYLDMHTQILKYNTDNASSKGSSVEITEYENAYNLTSPDNKISLHDIQSENNSNEYNKEALLFNHLMTNFSKNITAKDDNANNEIFISTAEILQSDIFQTEKFGISEKLTDTTTKRNVSNVSNDQIYAEILKRSHNTIHHTVKNSFKHDQQHDRKQQRKLEENLKHNFIMNRPNVHSVIQMITDQNNNVSNTTSMYMMDTCLIPIKFLKLHLIVFLFVVYFLPILFCSILHQHGKLNCQLILDKLKAKHEMLPNNFNVGSANDIDNTNFNKIFNENLNGNKKEQLEIEHDKKRMELNMIVQMENTLKLFGIIKMSSLCGTILWTPIFFEVLFKIFVQLHVPKWLLSGTYLVAVAFGILRNMFNLKMIKLQDIGTYFTKTNSVHPVN